MSKVEIIPPSRVVERRSQTSATVAPPRTNPGGVLSSTLARWEANRHGRVIAAVAERTRAEAALFDAQTQALESYGKRQRAAARVQELPEIIANDRAIRRAGREEQLEQIHHQRELVEIHRQTGLANADRVLLDARQALQAQRDHGGTAYDLEWKKRKCEILDVELSMAERRVILREHLAEMERNTADLTGLRPDASDDEVGDALLEARAQLRASGLETDKIDAVLSRRGRKPGR